MKSVRSAVTRVEREHRFELMRESDASPQLVDDLNADPRALARRGATSAASRWSSAARSSGRDPDFLLAVALDADGAARSASCGSCPCYGAGPRLLARPDAPRARRAQRLTEFLIANAALALGERGFDRLSMNFAAWGRLFDSGAAS